MKNWLLRAIACLTVTVLPAIAAAQAWPAKPVKLIVAFAAGGPVDLSARIVAEALTRKLIENGDISRSMLCTRR